MLFAKRTFLEPSLNIPCFNFNSKHILGKFRDHPKNGWLPELKQNHKTIRS